MAKVDKEFFNVDENIKQNTIEEILVPGEQVLVELHPDKKTFILESILKGLPLALIWGGFDFFFIYMMVTTGVFADTDGMMGGFFIPFIIVFFALHLIPVWAYAANVAKKVIGYKNISYVLTDKRIIIRSGLIGIDFKIFYYYEINSVDVKVGIFDRIFKVGDLYIKSQSQSAVIEDIKAPYAYASKIQKIILDLKTDIAYPNDLRPENNHGYNTNYVGDDKK